MSEPTQATSSIKTRIDEDRIAGLAWDLPGKPVNVWTEETIADFTAAVDEVVADEDVVGVIVASGKKGFHAGAELELALRFAELEPAALFERIMKVHRVFRKMETGGTPFAAAIMRRQWRSWSCSHTKPGSPVQQPDRGIDLVDGPVPKELAACLRAALPELAGPISASKFGDG